MVPFAGSGSELVVAKSLGYDFVGFELNDKYVGLGNSWLNQV
jgi:DNA modification methylase